MILGVLVSTATLVHCQCASACESPCYTFWKFQELNISRSFVVELDLIIEENTLQTLLPLGITRTCHSWMCADRIALYACREKIEFGDKSYELVELWVTTPIRPPVVLPISEEYAYCGYELLRLVADPAVAELYTMFGIPCKLVRASLTRNTVGENQHVFLEVNSTDGVPLMLASIISPATRLDTVSGVSAAYTVIGPYSLGVVIGEYKKDICSGEGGACNITLAEAIGIREWLGNRSRLELRNGQMFSESQDMSHRFSIIYVRTYCNWSEKARVGCITRSPPVADYVIYADELAKGWRLEQSEEVCNETRLPVDPPKGWCHYVELEKGGYLTYVLDPGLCLIGYEDFAFRIRFESATDRDLLVQFITTSGTATTWVTPEEGLVEKIWHNVTINLRVLGLAYADLIGVRFLALDRCSFYLDDMLLRSGLRSWVRQRHYLIPSLFVILLARIWRSPFISTR